MSASRMIRGPRTISGYVFVWAGWTYERGLYEHEYLRVVPPSLAKLRREQ